MSVFGKTFSYLITAGASVKLPGGNFFRLVTADAAVDVEFFDETGQSLGGGTGVFGGFGTSQVSFSSDTLDEVQKGKRAFSSVKITSATEQTVLAIVSNRPITYDRMSLSGNVDVSKADVLDSLADDSIAAVTTELVSAADTTRRKAVITNLITNTDEVRVGDVGCGAANGTPLQPGESITLETTAAIYVYNSKAGGAQSVAITITKD
jgi:hypothetical protein